MPPVKAKLGDRGNKRILMEVEINSGKENYACPFSHPGGRKFQSIDRATLPRRRRGLSLKRDLES